LKSKFNCWLIENLRFFEAFPIPTARWLKDGEPVDPKRGLHKNDNKKATLKIEKATRGDKGKYEVILTNSKGDVRVPIEVEVIDKPAAPEGPLKVSDVTANTAVLTWKPPKDDGGAPIDSFIIEKMDVSRGEWTPVDTVSGVCNQVKVPKLTALKEYKFRVRAVNKEGEGPNLEAATPTLAKNPYDEPTAPGTPEITDWDKDRVDLSWTPPESDGGAAIEKYVVEKREKGGKGPWMRVNQSNLLLTLKPKQNFKLTSN
jgi:hypothetical protein